MEPTLESLKVGLDTVWVILAGCLVFWMGTGFAMLETGLARAKHTVNVLAMNYTVLAVSALAFWAVGFGLMFSNGNAFVGLGGFLPTFVGDAPIFSSLAWSTVPVAAKFFFQLAFADAAASIVSGIVAERMKFSAYMLFCFVLIGVLYPITGHWPGAGAYFRHAANSARRSVRRVWPRSSSAASRPSMAARAFSWSAEESVRVGVGMASVKCE